MGVEQRATSTTSSFRSMYREHYGLVWGAARRFGVEDHLLDDTVQEAFLVAYRRMGSFGGGSPKAWLYGITRRVASNVRRTEQRTTRRKDAVRHAMQASRSRPAEAVEAWQALDRFVSALPEDKREIFVLSELEGMTGAEVARTLGLRPSTTYDAIRALRRRFREEVDDAPRPEALQRLARRERPKATARSWAALVAAMPGAKLGKIATASSAYSWSTMTLGAKVVGVGLGAAGALALAVVLRSPEPDAGPERARRTAPAASSAEPMAPVPAPAVPSPAEAAEPVEEPPPEPPAPEAPPAPDARPPAEGPAAPPAAPRSLAAENALLRDAAAALAAGDAAAALTLADRHAKDHADSPMVDISTALRIESLCALGKQAQARGEAAVFLRRRATSPMADRIRDACPEESTAGP